MQQPLVILFLGLALSPIARAEGIADCPDLKPFTARYAVYRDHELAGETVSRLEALENGHYRYSVETYGTHGWARLLGVRIEESSEFMVHDNEVLPIHFKYRKAIALSTKKRSAVYNWSTRQAHGDGGDGPWSMHLDGPVTDKALVNFALMLSTCRGDQHPKFTVIKRGKASPWTYRRDGRYKVPTPLGDFIGIRVDRIHPNPNRHTTTWHIPEFGFIAARLDHDDPEDPPVSMLLMALERDGKSLHAQIEHD